MVVEHDSAVRQQPEELFNATEGEAKVTIGLFLINLVMYRFLLLSLPAYVLMQRFSFLSRFILLLLHLI